MFPFHLSSQLGEMDEFAALYGYAQFFNQNKLQNHYGKPMFHTLFLENR